MKVKILTIVGQTGSGKSALAMKVAKKFKGEVISADSWAVYRGFDIGTAKPTAEDREQVKHHLIDVADAAEGFNAPQFQRLARIAIDEIQSRGNLPIISGGTGLYIDSVLYDYGFLPTTDNQQRQWLNEQDISSLIQIAGEKRINLESIDKNNKRRVIRAIEAGGIQPKKGELLLGAAIVGISCSDDSLRQNIKLRVDKMFSNGLEEEVRRLALAYDWGIEAMKGIGYKELRPLIEGKKSVEETKQEIIKNTLALAKRQKTWFKRNSSIQWFVTPELAYKRICTLLNT